MEDGHLQPNDEVYFFDVFEIYDDYYWKER